MLAKRCFTVVHLLQRGRSPPSLLATLFGCLLMLLLITTIIIWHYQQQNDVDQKVFPRY
jgi:hypothetical protein